MKKRNTAAILLASTLMLALVGCEGVPNASEGSSDLEMTEEAKREVAKAEMVASEDASDAASSAASTATEAATAASSETSVAAATTASSTAASTDSTTNKDAATTASSADKTTNSAASTAASTTTTTTTTQQTPAKLADHEIMYNGKAISVLNDASKTLADLGSYKNKKSYGANELTYSYDYITFSTYTGESPELPLALSVLDSKSILTSRNIGIGDSKDKVISAYGNPAKSENYTGQTGSEYVYTYEFGTYNLYFYFNSKENNVLWYGFDNNTTVAKNKQQTKASTNTNTTVNIDTSKLQDHQFTYNNNVISIFSDFNTINQAMGGYNPSDSNIQNLQSLYSYGKNEAVGMISRNDFGTETPITISTRKPVMTTSRGIKVGSSKDELIAAYGTPNGKHAQVFDGPTGRELTEEEYVQYFGESFVYDMGDYTISFSVENGKVASIEYKNDANYDKFQWS